MEPRRVLVVEDDPDTRQFYTAALTLAGLAVEQAHNGLQALEKITARPPDLVVTDVAVPGIDGIELCRRLRADQRTRGVPVLAITGYSDRDYADRVRSAGADAVLTKPCAPDRLVAAAARLIGESHELRPVPSQTARRPLPAVIPDQPTALWTLYKDGREMACLARLMPYGIEIDIAYDGATVSTRAFDSGDDALAWAAQRRRDRESNGWNERSFRG